MKHREYKEFFVDKTVEKTVGKCYNKKIKYRYAKGGGSMNIKLAKEQKTVLNQQMQQSMKLLQMNSHELEAYINELSMENPLIEIKPPREMRPRSERQYSPRAATDPNIMSCTIADKPHNTLSETVKEQINYMHIPELLRCELLWLAEEMDERGYLPEEMELYPFGGSAERYENALKVFQSLEPAGVGARSLGECLLLQLRRSGEEDEVAERICLEYLDRLAKGQFKYIAEQLNVTVRRIEEARALISKLEPNPSNGYYGGGQTIYVRPDVEVVQDNNGLAVALADRYMPTYGIDSFYLGMSRREDLSREEREYFREKLTQAKWAMSCIDRRASMLMACAEKILEIQHDFFADGVSPLKPLTMVELASSLGVHASTVSRTVRSKYISCHWGVFCLADFFKKDAAADDMTEDTITKMIKELIASEDPASPLSDKAIAEKLGERNVNISRRTVAKYRENAMIPSTSVRRKR